MQDETEPHNSKSSVSVHVFGYHILIVFQCENWFLADRMSHNLQKIPNIDPCDYFLS